MSLCVSFSQGVSDCSLFHLGISLQPIFRCLINCLFVRFHLLRGSREFSYFFIEAAPSTSSAAASTAAAAAASAATADTCVCSHPCETLSREWDGARGREAGPDYRLLNSLRAPHSRAEHAPAYTDTSAQMNSVCGLGHKFFLFSLCLPSRVFFLQFFYKHFFESVASTKVNPENWNCQVQI